ncbi:hypothetical protein [Kitasatospora sp. MBT66]|uniref:hypothetical protein n=1 Tax=Kitasatospora sp. MBT66 TaxID=1444769 RepID=UPI0011EA7076|nr:hypothetical protein [Kitasatospora sp. MBT66]
MKSTVPQSRRGRIAAIGSLLIVLLGLSIWNLPLATQWRASDVGESLLLQSPPMAATWERKPDEDPGAPYMRGLDRRVERMFVQDSADPLTGTFIQTVMEFDSPTWAWLVFRAGSPDRRYARYGEVERLDGSGVAGADEQHFFCAHFGGGECNRWYAWLRFGQYLIEVQVTSRMLAATSSEMLKTTVATIKSPNKGVGRACE